MAKGSLRRYDVQAKISLYVSAAAAIAMVALVALLARNYRAELRVIAYRPQTMYAPLVYLATAAALLMAVVGAALGAVSAGQARNTFNKRSWAAFFIGGITFSLTLILFYFFFRAKIVG